MLIIKKLDALARLALGAGGRGFESRRPDNELKPLIINKFRWLLAVLSMTFCEKEGHDF